jgi:hypothetical protein
MDAGTNALDYHIVAVLSDALWRRRFSSNPAIVGTDITLDGNIYSVIGMPAFAEIFSNYNYA